MKHSTMVTFVVALGATISCTKPAMVLTSQVANPTSSPEYEQFLERIYPLACNVATRCQGRHCAPIGVYVDVCHPYTQAQNRERILSGIARGELFFDSLRARRAIEVLTHGLCGDVPTDWCDILLDPALEAFVLVEDLTCTGDGECGGRLCCDGRCQLGPTTMPRSVGEPCTRNADCQEGLHCAMGQCGVPLERHAPCAASSRLSACREPLVCTRQGCDLGSPEGAICSNAQTALEPCSLGLVCDGTHCRVARAVGESCAERDTCIHGSECRGQRCTPLPTRGERCGGRCLDSLCEAGHCRLAAEGEPCAAPNMDPCAPGTACDYSVDLCRRITSHNTPSGAESNS